MYARMLAKPDFIDARTLDETANRLPLMTKETMYVKVPTTVQAPTTNGPMTVQTTEERIYANRVAVFNTATREVVGDVEADFALTQHSELLQALGRGLGPLGLPYKGSIRTSKDGSYMTGVVVFQDDPASTAAVNQAFRNGIEFRNALDTSGKIEFNGFVERKVCRNGRTATEQLGSISSKHTSAASKLLIEQVPQFVVDVASKSGAYDALWNEANAEQVKLNTVPLLLKGVGLPDRGIMDVVSNMHEYEPDTQKDGGLTRATLHEAANYWLNHVANLDMRRIQTISERVHQLMETDLDRLMVKVGGN